jgi:hypothetical protein
MCVCSVLTFSDKRDYGKGEKIGAGKLMTKIEIDETGYWLIGTIGSMIIYWT